MEVQPGYWDYERCAWVGVEPTDVMPSLRSPSAVSGVTLPAQSGPTEPEPVDTGQSTTILA
jgi:hypothetical protein